MRVLIAGATGATGRPLVRRQTNQQRYSHYAIADSAPALVEIGAEPVSEHMPPRPPSPWQPLQRRTDRWWPCSAMAAILPLSGFFQLSFRGAGDEV